MADLILPLPQPGDTVCALVERHARAAAGELALSEDAVPCGGTADAGPWRVLLLGSGPRGSDSRVRLRPCQIGCLALLAGAEGSAVPAQRVRDVLEERDATLSRDHTHGLRTVEVGLGDLRSWGLAGSRRAKGFFLRRPLDLTCGPLLGRAKGLAEALAASPDETPHHVSFARVGRRSVLAIAYKPVPSDLTLILSPCQVDCYQVLQEDPGALLSATEVFRRLRDRRCRFPPWAPDTVTKSLWWLSRADRICSTPRGYFFPKQAAAA